MSETVTVPLHGWWTRAVLLWARQPWGSNPLMRPSDRWQAAVRIAATLAILIAVPIACALGTAAYTDSAAAIRAERATKTAVPAVLSDEPTTTGQARHYEARVQWNQNGSIGTATVPVRRIDKQGDHVTVWLDADGVPTTAPRDPDAAPVVGIGVAVVVLVGVWLCGWSLVRMTDWLLDRRRDARWTREWRQMNRRIDENK